MYAPILFFFIVGKSGFPSPGNTSARYEFLTNGVEPVTLVMDANKYTTNNENPDFSVCRYNISSLNQKISCCECLQETKCDWGTLNNYYSAEGLYTCQVNTTQAGKYQFQVYTRSYPCFLNIGNPMYVRTISGSDDKNVAILAASISGGIVIMIAASIIIGTTIYCTCKTRQNNQAIHGSGGNKCSIMLYQ